jgi:hypothetical protein
MTDNLSFLINTCMRIRDIISETTAGAVAGVATGLGGGDPAASIYHKNGQRKKQKKSKMIRRPAMEKNDEQKD